MFNPYKMSQLAQGPYFPIILWCMFIGIGELHPTERRGRVGLTNKNK